MILHTLFFNIVRDPLEIADRPRILESSLPRKAIPRTVPGYANPDRNTTTTYNALSSLRMLSTVEVVHPKRIGFGKNREKV